MCVYLRNPSPALGWGTVGFAEVCQGEFHSAESGDVKSDSSNVTVTPLTTPT